MKKILLICCLAIGISKAAFSQDSAPVTPDSQVELLKTQVTGITDEQAAKLKMVYTTYDKSKDSLISAAKQSGKGGGVLMQAYMKMLMANDEKIKAVLTADQATSYQTTVADPRNTKMKQYILQQSGN